MPKATGQLARVGVPAETWQTFRQVALVRGLSISRYLGDLVEAELGRRHGRLIEAVTPDMSADEQALVGLAEIRRSIDELDQIAGRLAREALRAGRSWDEVASRLQISPGSARNAYEEHLPR